MARTPSSTHSLRPGLPDGAGLFEQEPYLIASAAHEGTTPVVLDGNASLALLGEPEGGLHTVYGYPLPVGDEGSLDALADALTELDVPLRVALSPLGAGAQLADRLRERVPVAGTRPICVADLDDEPESFIDAGTRRKVGRALRGGASASIGPLDGRFGPLYRSAMASIGASDPYFFGDDYVATLAMLEHFQVAVEDEHGLAAISMFLLGADGVATYHLSARRPEPAGPPGLHNLAIVEGLREARRRGAKTMILGGGRTEAEDDNLLAFKRGFSTAVLPRPTFVSGSRS